MANKNEIEYKGFDELQEAFAALSYVGQKQTLARAARRGAEPVQIETPRQPPVHSGSLSQEIMIVVSEQTAEGVVAKIGPSKRAFYGSFVNQGTRFMAAEEFASSSLQDAGPEAIFRINETLRDEIERRLRRR